MYIKTNLTVKKDVYEEFREICKENAVNSSAWLQKKMEEFIEQFKKEGRWK